MSVHLPRGFEFIPLGVCGSTPTHQHTTLLQGLVLLAPAVDITELWWAALSAGEQADARATGFVPLGGGTKVRVCHVKPYVFWPLPRSSSC